MFNTNTVLRDNRKPLELERNLFVEVVILNHIHLVDDVSHPLKLVHLILMILHSLLVANLLVMSNRLLVALIPVLDVLKHTFLVISSDVSHDKLLLIKGLFLSTAQTVQRCDVGRRSDITMHSTTMRSYNEISENNNPFPETYGGILSSAFEIGEFYTCKKLLIFISNFSASIKNY